MLNKSDELKAALYKLRDLIRLCTVITCLEKQNLTIDQQLNLLETAKVLIRDTEFESKLK